jgi:hypothetical protein
MITGLGLTAFVWQFDLASDKVLFVLFVSLFSLVHTCESTDSGVLIMFVVH